MESDCSCAALQQELACVKSDVDTLWDEVFGTSERSFIFTGSIGVPCDNDTHVDPVKFQQDQYDYTYASLLLSNQEAAGVFVLGGGNFDFLQPAVAFNLYDQEKKVLSGFGNFVAKQRFYPVMGDVDYFPTQIWALDPPGGTTGPEGELAKTWLRMFPYLSDAKRYYSVYDDESSTEFFVLSSGRYADVSGIESPSFWTYAQMDPAVGNEQYNWFVARATASQAKNKVVLFHHTFVSLPTAINAIDDTGGDHITADFADWNFEALGIRLIINGHSGYSYHLRRGSLHIVNASAFVRSRISAVFAGQAIPRPVPTPMGQSGWAVEYSSVANPNLEIVPGVPLPSQGNAPEDYIVSKTEYININVSRSGLRVEHWSYDLSLGNYLSILNSKKLEHSFELEAND